MANIYVLDYIYSSRKGHSEDWGPVPQEMKNEYWELEAEYESMFKSNGNNLARMLYEEVINQANVTADTKAGTDLGGYGNNQWNRGLCFCNSVPNQVYRKNIMDSKFRNEVRKVKLLEPMYPISAKYEELVTPTMFNYDRTEFENLVKEGLGEYYLYAGQSITHTYADPQEPLKETLIYLRENMPPVKAIVLGKMSYKTFVKNEMIQDWNDIYTRLIERYGNIPIIHFPHLQLRIVKTDNTTGNLIVSRTGYKSLKNFLSVMNGKIKPSFTI